MDFDSQEYERELREARLELGVRFDPRKHPRDFLGRFREVFNNLDVGDVMDIPADELMTRIVTVEKLPDGQAKIDRSKYSVDQNTTIIEPDTPNGIAEIRQLEREVGDPLDTHNDREIERHRVAAANRDAENIESLRQFVEELNEESLSRKLSIRMPLSAFWSFADMDEYLTQHEIGDSMGVYNPDKRDSQERYWWPGIVDEENRPIYGYLSSGAESDDRVGFYGDVILRLEDRVKSRTTFTLGDSLDEDELRVRQIPMMIGGVDAFAVQEIFDNSEGPTDEDLYDVLIDDLNDVAYWEAQVFGGVKLEDVAEIIIENRIEYYDLEILDHYGIPYTAKVVRFEDGTIGTVKKTAEDLAELE